MSRQVIEEAWNKVRGDNPEYAGVSADFRAKLQSAFADAQAGQPVTGIAGLEEFEAEVRKGVKPEGEAVPAGTPTNSDSVARQAEQPAEETPKGSGAQDSAKGQQAKAERDAAGAGARVEHDEVNSPNYPSAARPLAAEAPGGASAPSAANEGAGASKKSGSKSAGKSAAKQSASKKEGAKQAGSKSASKNAAKKPAATK